MSIFKPALALLVAVACLAICTGRSSAALQLQLLGASTGATGYLLPFPTTVRLNCSSVDLPSGGNYSWSRSVGDPSCGTAVAGLTTFNASTSLSSSPVTCYRCVYTYADPSSGLLVSQNSSLLLYPFPAAGASTTVDLATVTSADLTCSNAGLSTALNATSMRFVWTRYGSGSAQLSGSVSTTNTSTLVVANSSTAGGGRYYCHGVMADASISGYETNGVSGALLATYEVLAPPHADMYAFSQIQYTEGDTVTVACKVLGYPTPTAAWQREGASFHPTSVQNVSILGGMNVSFIISSLDAVTERGKYACIANGTRNGTAYSYSSTAKTLHARTKLAPLWPAIGIIAEIALVAIIIGVTELLQANKAMSAGGKGSAQLNGSTKHSNAAANTVVNGSG